mmetsp:Transcript_6090/g.10959  ORF Transcript_6090/g.10959 Transcript_6090/m.10959 type:complete len:416 (-) Transcript_6090:103-1350(-)
MQTYQSQAIYSHQAVNPNANTNFPLPPLSSVDTTASHLSSPGVMQSPRENIADVLSGLHVGGYPSANPSANPNPYLNMSMNALRTSAPAGFKSPFQLPPITALDDAGIMGLSPPNKTSATQTPKEGPSSLTGIRKRTGSGRGNVQRLVERSMYVSSMNTSSTPPRDNSWEKMSIQQPNAPNAPYHSDPQPYRVGPFAAPSPIAVGTAKHAHRAENVSAHGATLAVQHLHSTTESGDYFPRGGGDSNGASSTSSSHDGDGGLISPREGGATSTSNAAAGSSAGGAPGSSTKPLIRKCYVGAKASQFCHVCRRSSKAQFASCKNLVDGSCRKVVCNRCFVRYGWNWDEYLKNSSDWVCPHCKDQCPTKASCHLYSRINATRMTKKEKMNQVGGSTGNSASNSAGGRGGSSPSPPEKD